MWPRLTLSLGYPPCYPSPVLVASSNASSPHSSSLQALSAVRRCARGRATLVLARNRSSALVALGSPKSRPCRVLFCSSGSHNFIQIQILVELVSLLSPFSAFKEKDGVLSPLIGHNLCRLHPLGPGSDVGVLQWLHVLISVENTGWLGAWEPLWLQS